MSVGAQSEERQQRRAEFRNVITIAVPVVITTGSRAFMDIADYVMISHLPTDDAQAAILPAQILMWTYIVIGMGIVSMVNTYASQLLGKGQPRECSAYAWQSIYLGAAFAVPVVVLIPAVPFIVTAVGHEAGVQASEIAYLQVALLTAGPTIAAMGIGWFFIGIHRPLVTMWSAIEANVVNVTVSFVLIFGYLGFEPLGIAGAAWGTFSAVCYRTVRLAVTLVLPSIDGTYGSRAAWRPSPVRLKRLIRFGTPFGLQMASEVAVWAIFVNVLIGRTFGKAELIATNTAWQFMRVAFLPMIGVGQALTALVGKSIGAGDPQRAIREARYATLLTWGYLGPLSVAYALFGAELIALLNDDPAVVRTGRLVMICAAVFQVFDAVGITYSSALRGAGDTFIPAVFFVVSTWVIIIGGGWWMIAVYPELGSLGPWLAASVLIAVTALFLWCRWRGRSWMKIDIFRA